jgi:membrane-bound lytic murein transglycosylase D
MGPFLIVLYASASAFTTISEFDVNNNPKDSLPTEKNSFKSLFTTPYFDARKPYTSQLNPRAVPFVQDYIRLEGKRLEKMKVWGKPYFDLYDGILGEYDLPKELKYLSVIESDLIPNVVSWAGAVGPWQIMATEARRMGLRILPGTDERTNFYKSTHAAAKILRELHKQFSDWTLVIAAYNCGAGRVKQAMRKSGSRNFWDLQPYLPEETRNHVKRFISTHYIFEGSGGLTTMTASEVSNSNVSSVAATNQEFTLAADPKFGTIEINGKYKGAVIAKNLNLDLPVFNKLNPDFDKKILSGKTYNLRLPVSQLAVFRINKHAILEDCIKFFLNF